MSTLVKVDTSKMKAPSYRFPAISIMVKAGGYHISEIVYDALSLAKEMRMKVVVSTCRGDLEISPDDTAEEIVELFKEL